MTPPARAKSQAAIEAASLQLIWAARHAQLPEIRAALAYGADPSGRGIYKETALLAALSGCLTLPEDGIQCVRELLPISDTRAVDNTGTTPLMLAAQTPHIDLLDALSQANPLAVDSRGRSALMHAAMWRQSSWVIGLLPLSDPLARDENGRDALMHAAIGGSLECVRALTPFCDLLGLDLNGRSASELALKSKHPVLSQLLKVKEEAAMLSSLTLLASARESQAPRL